jgi:hypothetical protein
MVDRAAPYGSVTSKTRGCSIIDVFDAVISR